MKQETIDLKSLKVLHSVIETKSVSAAAEMLSTSPSSITYAINKLRDATANPIFTRGKGGMVPTTLALDLNARYVKALSLINDGLGVLSGDDESEHVKDVTVSTYTLVELWLSLALLQNETALEGRSLTYIVHPISDEERIRNLRNREVDIDIGTALPPDRAITSYQVIHGDMVVAVSKNHSEITDQLTAEHWFEQQHVVWKRTSNHATKLLGDALTLNKIKDFRKVSITTTSSLNMLMLSTCSDHLMLIPRFFAGFVKQYFPVNIFEIPFDVTTENRYYLHVHNQSLNDISVNGLIGLINKLAGKKE